MPLYEYACPCGYRFEKTVSFADADSPLACPACGAGSRRLLSPGRLLGRASPPPGRDAAPRSWEQTNGGDAELIGRWHRTLEKRQKLEEKYPELAGDTRPVLAHEGPYAAEPLRANPGQSEK